MRKRTWIPLLIVIIGVCLALAGFAGGGVKGIKGLWLDRGGFHLTSEDRGNLIKVDETYDGCSNIEVNVDFINKVTLREGDDFRVRGQNYERFGGMRVEKNGSALIVNSTREGRWLNLDPVNWHGNWNTNDCWIEITYPAGSKLDFVAANISAGRISVSDIDCGTLRIYNDFGDVEVNVANANDIIFNLSAGNAKVRSALANNIDISNDFGKVDLESTTANNLTINISSGDVSADTINAGDLFVQSDFGSVKFERLDISGRGNIKMSAGDVNIGLSMSEDDIDYDLNTELGRVTVDGRSGGSLSHTSAGSGASLSINSDFGAITLRFLG